MTIKVLVTGYNGYIGKSLCKMLKERGDIVYGIDPVNECSDYVDGVFDYFDVPDDVDAIVHLGASSRLNASFTDPLEYWDNNVNWLMLLLDRLNGMGYDKSFVFASSAAVYGDAPVRHDALTRENEVKDPINPYGNTKLAGEHLIRDAARVGKFKYANCRLFNVAGSLGVSQQPEGLLLRSLCEAGDAGEFNCYNGNTVRDFIHVKDVCLALIEFLNFLPLNDLYQGEYNISTGVGTSLWDFIKAFKYISNTDCKINNMGGRTGDPLRLVGDNSKIFRTLRWKPLYSSIGDMIESQWKYFKELSN